MSNVNVDGPEGTYLSTHGERVAVYKDHVSWDLEMGNLTAPDKKHDNILAMTSEGSLADHVGPSEPDLSYLALAERCDFFCGAFLPFVEHDAGADLLSHPLVLNTNHLGCSWRIHMNNLSLPQLRTQR